VVTNLTIAAMGLAIGVPLEQLRRYSIVRAGDFSPCLISPQGHGSCHKENGNIHTVVSGQSGSRRWLCCADELF
jgi:hypothetical protein